MDKTKIKRVVAREGLIILSLIAVGLLLMFLGDRITGIRAIETIGAIILFLGYPFYLFIHFTRWAVRTLR